MAQDDPPRREPGASRARTGGSARPLDDYKTPSRPPRPASTHRPAVPPRPASPPASAAPSAIPPSISPAGANQRPAAFDDAIPVGRATRPSAPTASRPAPIRPGQPRASTPARPPLAPPKAPRAPGSRRKRIAVVAAVVAVLLLAWPIGLLIWANGKIQHVDALSGAADTPGTTYLLAGSDSRGDEGGIGEDGTEGARTDTIMLLHVPPSGPAALISLPRDTYAEIPGRGANKLNAAYSWGQAPLLVQTVEQLSGMRVDHFVEIGLGGVAQVVDALGGVELCLDPAVNLVDFPLDDVDSGLVWDAPGCKLSDGNASLAFARMRKADREGDIGRAKRQQQLIAALSSDAATPSLALNPGRQVALVTTGLGALQVSNESNILDLGRLALAFRSATGPDGIRGTPPIRNPDYRPGDVGSTVQLDPDATPGFFAAIMNGTLPPGPVGGMPGA